MYLSDVIGTLIEWKTNGENGKIGPLQNFALFLKRKLAGYIA